MNRIFVIFALLLAFVAQVHAQKEQSFMLTGTVFDEFNEPVPGANVYVKDKPGVGITTNIDGKFRLKVNIYDIVVVIPTPGLSLTYTFAPGTGSLNSSKTVPDRKSVV